MITFDRCPKVFGNIIAISDLLIAKGGTTIGTLESGCGSNDSPGSPLSFASQSFNCTPNGGSYGGRGGIGVSTGGDFNQTLDCIRNSYPLMREYGDPLKPLISGATGSVIPKENGVFIFLILH